MEGQLPPMTREKGRAGPYVRVEQCDQKIAKLTASIKERPAPLWQSPPNLDECRRFRKKLSAGSAEAKGGFEATLRPLRQGLNDRDAARHRALLL